MSEPLTLFDAVAEPVRVVVTPSLDRPPIVVATDGSALGTPGPAGWCWWVDEGCWAAGGSPSATNNWGELSAILEALKATVAVREHPLVIESDSQYAIDCVTKWIGSWKRNGWLTKAKEPVKNRELIQGIDAGLTGRSVRFVKVKGHSGHPRNDQADLGCTRASAAYRDGHGIPSGPGWTR